MSAPSPTRFGAAERQPGHDVATSHPPVFAATPNAERHMLEAENLRRRQLRSALLHGSATTWRKRPRVWPAALAGVIVVAVIIAVIGVYGAFQRQQAILDEEQRRRQPASASTR